ncbi:hypothetical protein [Filimonas effusa]|uniref:Uncharacterized protein n=1 Tax=Filimonas effusa TaxID=2508721 RepID=A0A4Q1DBN6_9BACT|nr:hypothetical protein [Filimonas effusa]RXK86195.1 hypothetical protein ESB13_05140 [Filimonas effusa]
MNDKIRNKIQNFLRSETCLLIINEPDFYFQKAKDTLDEYLNLEVTGRGKEFLLDNKKDYHKLKDLFENNDEFYEFGRLIFTLISYCDTNANRKKEFNLYEDKRVLALASVRMNSWVEQLIVFKFTGELQAGSIRNAINYLQAPADHFTMLSENHRNQICENLFGKTYNEATFKGDFFEFFSEFYISVQNDNNYTHLLTRMSYDINTEWKGNIIGLVCPDDTVRSIRH